MVELNRDVLYLILKKLQDNKKALYSCLFVSKIWCEIIIPLLWKHPWKDLRIENEKKLSNIIISHLPDNSMSNLIQQKNISCQKPLFDYISFCKHLDLCEIKRITYFITDKKDEVPIVMNEILKLFINENRIFTHLYVPYKFDHQIHLIPGAKHCFSELRFLYCNSNLNDNILIGLMKIGKSIKELEFLIDNVNYGLVKLIETSKDLSRIHLKTSFFSKIDESFCKHLESSLKLHSKNIKYFKSDKPPVTDILSSFVNLEVLELHNIHDIFNTNLWVNSSLPFLQIIKTKRIPIKALANLIENTNGNLFEINIEDTNYGDIDNRLLIKAIQKNCPKLKYLKLLIKYNSILDLEELLINCKYLKGLFLLFNSQDVFDNQKNIDILFKILAKSSPTSLFKFKFYLKFTFILKFNLKLLFDDWKGRNPMLLQAIPSNSTLYIDLLEKYKAEGIIKTYDNILVFEDFDW
ncbi:hypothetical protein RclHR1_00010023 [Rhizophagus clarus]|uniref:F-box domain-containing protein n=1 Tax=Rhizophagus clarus TaxID=94130 RepID=A0A2Z6QEF1_9GLOM|nr:hypothetical protein RclHR1_00010023 [Rhizophagus clarus]GES75185.1 hypothetical protein GLOIN_2v1866989 [Rhizophagus clarus]